MTRINVVPVQELTDKHLTGENHEILRVVGLVRKAKARGINKYNFTQKVKAPLEYTLGEGHVKFFYSRLGFIMNRYYEIQTEMLSRGFSPNTLTREDVLEGIDSWWLGGYTPTPEALKINRKRLEERM
jgi:hypothetical protein